ncbi:MAG: hypothetical protein ACM335_07110 [Deltaproteobacteria bacterium]
MKGKMEMQEIIGIAIGILIGILGLGLLFFLPAISGAELPLVLFEGGIGVIPRASAAGALNVVRDVQPAGQIWVIRELTAAVEADGRITVDGKGLLLGGGNNIGGNGNASVFATLICEATAPFTELSTNPAGVPLEPNGDFRIDDVLTPAPFDCASPVLLIRNAANLGWFAAGIPKR